MLGIQAGTRLGGSGSPSSGIWMLSLRQRGTVVGGVQSRGGAPRTFDVTSGILAEVAAPAPPHLGNLELELFNGSPHHCP